MTPKSIGILVTRDEADVLRLCLLHHLNQFCDSILVLDNGSTDGSHEVLRRLARKHPIDWSVDAGEYRQSEMATALAHEAIARGAEWVVPLDTDEFWISHRYIREIMDENATAGALQARRFELIQQRSVLEPTPRGILSVNRRVPHPELSEERVARFAAGELSMFEVRPADKIIVRASEDIVIHRGAHSADGLAGPVVFAPDIELLHAPIRSRRCLERKAEHGLRVIAQSKADEAWQVRRFAEDAAAGRLDETWAEHSHESGRMFVKGREVELVRDDRLEEFLGPYLRPVPERIKHAAGAPVRRVKAMMR